ncbi:hypothetical protein PtB15_4B596 [Puccinia triticina]|nr:hypothetical protein PtB15_4B596 [Puccinia triticina]
MFATRPRPTPKPRAHSLVEQEDGQQHPAQAKMLRSRSSDEIRRRTSQKERLPQLAERPARRLSQPHADGGQQHAPRKLHNRASTPLFSLAMPAEHDPHRGPDALLSRPSTPSLLQRIKAGLTPKSSFASAEPSPEHSAEILPVPSRKPSPGTAKSASELQLAYFDLSQSSDKSIFPLYRSQSDSLGQHHRQTMEELRPAAPLATPAPAPPLLARSFSQVRLGSPIAHRTSELFNRSLGPSSPSAAAREYNREPFAAGADLPRLKSATAASASSSNTTQHTVSNKLRRPRTSASHHQSQPLIELAKKSDNKDKEPAKTSGKLKPLARATDDESEETYLSRLGTQIEKSKIPSVLASSNDPFHLAALTKYMGSFEFSHDPIDLSIRKLLMVVDLPTETQQIDRVIEAFAKRYVDCNPKLFASPDQVYILAFSIIMLHTDAFNKSNKAKMSRADYVKNTRMDGIPNELLEYIYDNVTFTPFVYVDPERNITGQKMTHTHQQPNDGMSTSFFNLGGNVNNMTPILQSSSILPGGTKEGKGKLDPYQLIAKGSTHELRPDLGAVIPSRNPFSFTGSVSWFDFKRLRESFNPAKSVIIQVVNLVPTTKPHSIFKLIESEDAAADEPLLSRKPHEDNGNPDSRTLNLAASPGAVYPGFLNLRAIKVGLVHLKIDAFTPFSTAPPAPLPPSSNTSNTTSFAQPNHSGAGASSNLINELSMAKNVISKKWKLFCVLLTARQLILIKDVGLAAELQESIKLAGFRNQANPEDQLVVRITGLKPDLVLSLDGGVALMDSDYQRRPCTFRLILTKDLSLLMGVDDNEDMNSWITHINYAATYKTHRLPFWPSHTYQASPRPSMSSTPVAGNSSRVYQRAALNGAESNPSNNEDSSESLLSSSSLRHHHHQQQHQHQHQQYQHQQQESRRTSLDRAPISRSSSFSNSLFAARPFEIGPNLIGESPRSSSVHSQRHSTVSSTNLLSHWDLVRAQIVSLEGQILAAKTELNEDLRLARNLAVLTPFQFSTRSKLQLAIMPVANRVRNSRSQLSKLVCYREIFVRDLALSIAGSAESAPAAAASSRTTTAHAATPRLSDTVSSTGSRNPHPAGPEEIRIRNSVERASSAGGDHRDLLLSRASRAQSVSSTRIASGVVHIPEDQAVVRPEETDRTGDPRPLEIISRPVVEPGAVLATPHPPAAATSHDLSASASSSSTVVLPAPPFPHRPAHLHPTSSAVLLSTHPTLVTSPVQIDGIDEAGEEEEEEEDEGPDAEEVLACLRKVGRHPLAGLKGPSDTILSRPSHTHDAGPPSSGAATWGVAIGRSRSGTSISGRSARDTPPAGPGAPLMSTTGSTRSIVKIPFLSSSSHAASRKNPPVSAALFDPPAPPPPSMPSASRPAELDQQHHQHILRLSASASAASIHSSAHTTASTITPLPGKPSLLGPPAKPAKSPARAAARARMLDKARLVAASCRPFSAVGSSSGTGRSAKLSTASLSPPLASPPRPPAPPATSPRLLSPILSPSSHDQLSSASSLPIASRPHRSRSDSRARPATGSASALGFPPPPPPAAKRFTQAWGLP